MARRILFTSESVSDGHPDKIADTISDAVVDLVLAVDSKAHVACEALITKGLVVVAGEIEWPEGQKNQLITTIKEVIYRILNGLGYNPSFFDIQCKLNQQSPQILQGVRQSDGVIGAGDQGLMFGYATDETSTLMPLPISLAHALMNRQGDLRRSGHYPWLLADAKAQVSVSYDEGVPIAVESVVLSTQHTADIETDKLRELVIQSIIEPIISEELRSEDIRYWVNPTGRFEIGGPEGDTGLTGRKIIVDTYGGACPHGGGAFSGKDPTKVDRSAAYMARYIAKNVVAAGLSKRCTLQLAYAIGHPEPVSVYVNTHGSSNVDEVALSEVIPTVFDLSPGGIIQTLSLQRPIYQKTATYGHFGREGDSFTWEKTDKVDELRAAVG